MAKIVVCDICRKEGKLTESKRYTSMKGHGQHLRLDVCEAHKNTPPISGIAYVKYVYELTGVPISDQTAKEILLKR